jgi:hypothetical protein
MPRDGLLLISGGNWPAGAVLLVSTGGALGGGAIRTAGGGSWVGVGGMPATGALNRRVLSGSTGACQVGYHASICCAQVASPPDNGRRASSGRWLAVVQPVISTAIHIITVAW